jgi:hypothetical protein
MEYAVNLFDAIIPKNSLKCLIQLTVIEYKEGYK